ncbi:E3 ubiquitin-protein ligase Jade-2 isoform X1 [Equus przewalskii]|uniref:E3 ubiquitin-protein ligase Jade-2 isoform X1 n=2 Tax=Equus przewalskii TaxID=9798 RepID=A0ABM4KFW7_EQUPR|nr:E3 ubiquitin-protein ligase Jade-2 isoform X1 [Equus asinus]XP_044636413.1 E3 ubiquitin-protein ligase Jade-2 isoform X1 [Equus asinus]XP_044636414.1 E3 ubiquitin-protein ligase Jade-2 isoform X1 [Equus asinus]XP_044636415.1 E3 ubiquitin-protein ligase Jade-2 isoform X1 [Equus asinus]XP_044636416.1 E3 ubiquitin-protein ligase Jade-2 isoform X1 [Equus asinus]XP_044636420.1 E3 ubiquitin-protein ligase Jade-2 isoform X1 [Equus asinus]
MEEKRRKYSISSDNSDTTDSHATSASRCSKLPSSTKSGWPRQNEKKPSEVFRTDLITAMKIPDSYQLSPDDYYILADPWRQEWEKGVQVPAGAEAIPEPVVRILPQLEGPPPQVSPSSSELGEGSQPDWPGGSRYDLDEIDAYWLELINLELKEMERPELDELTLERVLEELETLCHQNMARAIETQEGLGIEYDEDVVCDVCRSPEGEDGNEMVFCDKCNVCVHQACYGILKVPTGSWLCRTCALGVQPKCLLCPKRGGALKPTRSGTKWVHVSCALWIPEVSIGCPEKMEPITKISHIPANRWALSCSLCKECTGTCIQCSMPACVTAFHVTCAFDHGLEMRTILADNDEVKFKSFCQEHSDGGPRGDPTSEPVEPSPAGEDLEKVTLRKQRLQQLEEDFYELVEPAEVAERLDLAEALVDFIYQYWKLKRKANANQPLLTPKTDEVDNLAQQEQDVLYRRLKLFTHLRQDLERVRNLCYMVTRRERTKHAICKLQEQIFHLQMKLIEQDLCRELTIWKDKGKWCPRGCSWCQCNDSHIRDGFTATVILEQHLRRPRILLWPHIQLQKERQQRVARRAVPSGTGFQKHDQELERSGRRAKGKKSDSKRKGREGPKGSPEKKEKVKVGPDSVLGQLGLSTSFPIDGTFFNSWLAQSVQITAENMAMSEWSLNNGHREDPAPGLLSEELLQDEETLLSFMRDPSLRPSDPARKARGRTRLPAKKKPPQDGPGSRTTPDKPQKKPWGQDAGSGKGGQGTPARKPPRRTPSHLPSSPTAGDCPVPAAPDSPPPLAPETPDEAAPMAADLNVQVPGPTASPKPSSRLRLPRESKGTRRSPGARPDAGTGPPSAVAERPKVSLHFDTETDGYFSDGEMSDSDVEAEDSGVQRGPREAGTEEVVRMGVLAS